MRRESSTGVRKRPAAPQARMLLTGVAAQAVDMSTLVGLASAGWMPVGPAAIAAAFAGGAANFFMTRRWVFDVRGDWVRQFVVYSVSVVAGGALLCGAIVHLAVHAGCMLIAAKCIASVVTLVVWNYPVSAHLVFREEEPT